MIPSAATVYAQVVTSSFFRRCNTLESIHLPNGTHINPPSEVARCSGAAAVHDLQLGQVTDDMFTPLTRSVPVFRYHVTARCLYRVNEASELWVTYVRQKIKRQKVNRQKNQTAEIIVVIILYYKSISTTLKMSFLPFDFLPSVFFCL